MSNAALKLLSLTALACATCCFPVTQANASESDDQFAAASAQYTAKHWSSAVDEFQKFLHDYPDNDNRAKALFYQAEALVQLGRSAEAYPLLVDVLAEQPSGPLGRLALFGAAEAAVLSDQTDEAQLRLSQFQSQYPADKLNAKVLIYRGDMAQKAGDYFQAGQFYRESMDKFADAPTADQCRLNLAHVSALQQQPETADSILHEVAERGHSPWAEMALLQLATEDLTANKPQAALEQYEAIEQHHPNSPLLPQMHLGCGRALYELGHYTEAEGVLNPLVENPAVSADAEKWISLAQKAEKQARIAAEAKRKEAELLAAKTRAPKTDTASDNSAADAKQPAVVAQQNLANPTLTSIFSSRRDPNALPATPASPVAASDGEQNNKPSPADSSVAKDNTAANTSATAVKTPTITAAASADSALAATLTTKPVSLQPISTAATSSQEEQTRRQSALVRHRAAEAMMKAGQYDGAISTLEIGDNSGDDPQSLANRYLLAMALQASKRNDESQITLDDLSEKLQAKLAGNNSSANEIPASDLTALHTLNDSVQMARATALLKNEKYAEAIPPLKLYLATPRNDVGAERARSALAIALIRAGGHLAEAQQVLNDLKTNHPGSLLIISTTEQVADATYKAGQYQVAAALFADLAADGNPPEMIAKGMSGVAWSHLQLNEDEAADQAFAKFLEHFPNDPRAPESALARGQILEREGNFNAALALYREAIKRYGPSEQMPKFLHAAARLCDRAERPQDAAALYQRLVRDFPTYPEIDAALYSWAWSLHDLGHNSESDKVFRTLYENHPNSRYWGDAAYRLAEHASQQDQNSTADALLKQITEGGNCPGPVLQHALFLQAQIAIANEHWTDAEPPLTRMLHDFPEGSMHLAAQFWLAEAAYRSGDYITAQARFDALAQQTISGSEKWAGIVPLRRAQILAQQKHWDEALTLADNISHDFPQFAQQHEADYLIGRCLAEQAKFDEARAAFDRVVHSTAAGKTELAAIAQWMIGETYYHQGNYTAALREYLRTEVVYSYPHWQASALLQAAKCYEQLGQSQQASEMYARVLQNYSQTEFVAEASKRLVETTRN